jgi:hypothetical protein
MDISVEELQSLVDAAIVLSHQQMVKNLNTLGRIKNEAYRRFPDYSGTAQLDDAIKAERALQEKGL